MTRADLLYLFLHALNEAAGTDDFQGVLDDIRRTEDFLDEHEQEALVLEDA